MADTEGVSRKKRPLPPSAQGQNADTPYVYPLHKLQRAYEYEHHSGAHGSGSSGRTKYFPHGNVFASTTHGSSSSMPPAPRVQVSQPTEIACMSRRQDRSWVPGSRAGLPAYNPAPLPSDLNVGCESFFEQYIPEHPESLAHVLRCVQGKYGVPGAAAAPDFVTWRGNLTKLMCHPFSPRDAIVFGVWRHKKTIYISARETPDKQRRDHNMDDRSKRFMYYGYKFEECSTRPSPSRSSNNAHGHDDDADRHKQQQQQQQQHLPVDTNVCFGSVFKTRIGRHRVVACGEVDCFDPATKAKPGMENASYVELKVTKQQTTDRDVSSFERFKLLKWYCQSFIAGVPRIVCGFRDDRGTLHNTQTFNTTEIPPMLKSKYSPAAPPWDHRRLVSFLDQVLTWLSAEVVDEDATYELSYDGNARQSTLQLAPSHRLPDEEIRTELYL